MADEPQPTAPRADAAPADPLPPPSAAHPELPDEATWARVDAKPPRYRLVRGAVYATYLIAVVVFCACLLAGLYHSVWGEAGERLRAQTGASGR